MTDFEGAVYIVFILLKPKVSNVKIKVYNNKNHNVVKLRILSYKLSNIGVPLGYGLVVANVKRHIMNAKSFIAIIIFP